MVKAFGPMLSVLLLAACAQVGQITGGDKDETPPVLLAADPPHLSTNFSGRRIVLAFDERVQLDRVKERMLVSPPLDRPPEVRIAGGRNVIIDLQAPLKPNTTYTFGIGEAVKDLTEGNAAKGLVHVISTGSHLDSLAIAGTVVNAFTGEPVKEALVSLYEADDTVTVRSGRPAYAGRSDADGRFLLRHLRDGQYRLHALLDMNGNFRYDLPNEEIAFLDAPIAAALVDTAMALHELRLFIGLSKVQQVREARVIADGALRLVLAKPAQDIALRDLTRTGGRLQWQTEWSTGRDTVHCWPSDTTELQAGRYAVRIDGVDMDTLRYRPTQKMPFNTALQTRLLEETEGAMVRIRSSRPLTTVDPQRVLLLRDSLPETFTVMLDSTDRRNLLLRSELQPGASATLTLLPKAVIDLYGGYNDTLVSGIGRAAEQRTGTVRVKLEQDDRMIGPFILQLLDTQGRVVRQQRVPALGATVAWERLDPGNHHLRLIEDANDNGRWDTGDLDAGLQPERVLRYSGPLNVRAAWDLGVDWSMDP